MAYNGWSNKETWLVNLWLGDMLTMDQEEGIKVNTDYIEMIVDEMVSALMESSDANGLVTDLLNCALDGIDYHELAEHYQDD